MKSYLFSSLLFRYCAASVEAFKRGFPDDWLLWEPGGWSAACASTIPTPAPPTVPMRTGDALAFVLEPPDGCFWKLGRGPECDGVIKEGTLSQLHLVFMRDGRLWTVRDANSRNGTRIDGTRLEPGKPVPLSNGSRIQAGQLALTFHTSDGLLKRLQEV